MLFLDGVFIDSRHGGNPCFRRVKAPTRDELSRLAHTTRVANVAGFSLHAGVTTKANERAKLERLCRYITRPAGSTKRLSLTRNGQVRYELKIPWRNGTR